jgi:hypothetical protein
MFGHLLSPGIVPYPPNLLSKVERLPDLVTSQEASLKSEAIDLISELQIVSSSVVHSELNSFLLLIHKSLDFTEFISHSCHNHSSGFLSLVAFQ